MKQLISLMMALCLICASLPLSLAESTSPRMITTTFQAAMSPRLSYETEYDESVFQKDSGTYSHTLARMSLAMALAAFRPASLEDVQEENISRFFEQAGMQNLRFDQYSVGMDENTIGTAMGTKTIGSGSDAFQLVAVAVCGGRYGNEWLSNFKVGNPGDNTKLTHHQGFFEAATKVFKRVNEYTQTLKGPVKIWISGYSRGAAVSNLSAALLVQNSLVEPGNIFAYSFATPTNTLDPEAQDDQYRGLYSIIGAYDAVPRVPLVQWGFTRYGRTLTLPSVECDSEYPQYYEKASAWSEEHLGLPFYYSTFVNYTVEKILDALLAVVPTWEEYVNTLQKQMMELWRDKGNMLAVIGMIRDIYMETGGKENGWALNELVEESAWQGLLKWAGQGDLDVSDAHSFGQNLGREHFPDCYVSLLMANGEEIYDEERGAVRIAVMDHMNLSIDMVPDEEVSPIARLPHMEITKDGADNQLWPVIRFTGGSIVTLPLDQLYLLSMTGAKDDFVFLVLQFWNARDGSKAEKMITLDITEDEEQWFSVILPLPDLNPDKLTFKSSSRVVGVETLDPTMRSSLLDLVVISRSAGSQLKTVTIILGSMVLLLIITLLLSAFWAFRGRSRKASVTLLALLFVLFILIQLSHEFLPARGGFLAVFKGLAATTVLMECLLCTLHNKSRRNLLMLAGFVCYIVNDVLINSQLLTGMLFALAGNLFFSIGFLAARKPFSWRKAWPGLAAFPVGLAVILAYRHHASVGPYLAAMIVFLAVLCCFLMLGCHQGRLSRIGAVLLFFSTGFVFFYLIIPETWWSYIISLGTYYAAMMLLALDAKGDVRLPRLSSRAMRKAEMRQAIRKLRHARKED